ncbi:hypothetical protein [Chitinolyticbacter albus]|uniref:hypothetical protein n=1 Tax=Chitinolyticbacter albus TaxID=2961951 RepID=UPI00210AFCF3|nr:hypothetical protein [Chitinolyticbacter albus]
MPLQRFQISSYSLPCSDDQQWERIVEEVFPMLPLDLPDFTLVTPRKPGMPPRVVIVPMVPDDDDDDMNDGLPELLPPPPEPTVH